MTTKQTAGTGSGDVNCQVFVNDDTFFRGGGGVDMAEKRNILNKGIDHENKPSINRA
jgi:hypothetical protein